MNMVCICPVRGPKKEKPRKRYSSGIISNDELDEILVTALMVLCSRCYRMPMNKCSSWSKECRWTTCWKAWRCVGWHSGQAQCSHIPGLLVDRAEPVRRLYLQWSKNRRCVTGYLRRVCASRAVDQPMTRSLDCRHAWPLMLDKQMHLGTCRLRPSSKNMPTPKRRKQCWQG